MRAKDKERIVVETTRRVLERELDQAAQSREAYLDNLIHEVFYFEDRRLEASPYDTKDDRRWLNALRERARNASERDKRDILEAIIRRHMDEVVGHFSEATYRLSTLILPAALGFLLNTMTPLKLLRGLPRLPDVADNVTLGGETELVRALEKRGTIILTPTHSSNLDSIIAGWAIYAAGLPPFTYGAGLNLFHNKFLGFFMNRLGAYKVDRLKQHRLYKDVLKEYATVTIESGGHNLFFPGGTRSRSGAIEEHLKLGLLGCGLRAYANNLRANKENPNVYVVPCTINYQLVLEAETLIEDHLKEAGKQRYIIEDDEFSRLERIAAFLKNLVSLDARIDVVFSRPLDPFGNFVDEAGRSLDGAGRPIDIRRYLLRDGELAEDGARDAEFTRLLGEAIIDAFHRDTMIYPTHVVGWTIFENLRRRQPDPDFYRFLRQTGRDASLPMAEAYRAVDRTLAALGRLAERSRLRLAEPSKTDGAPEAIDRALKLFGCYHKRPATERRGDRLFPGDMNLLYYYRNRLWGYDLDPAATGAR
ncbi:MAG: hypothetical protein C4523_07675 [Myxococcales bacterium]|nr:MAG: hypothetical protein C4523_07675 [Myxococcales bacterium]